MNDTGQSFWERPAGRGVRMWLPLAAALTILCGVVYVVAQQQLRLGADDPQIALAEDTAAALRAGQAVAAVVPATPVDIATSVAPYLIVFDDAGKPLAGSARLNGSIPTVPAGVLAYVRQAGEDRITWQPQPGVRSAAVISRVDGATPGFVLAGRSLREVERRINTVEQLVAVGWLAGLAGLAVVCAGLAWLVRRPA